MKDGGSHTISTAILDPPSSSIKVLYEVLYELCFRLAGFIVSHVLSHSLSELRRSLCL
jgi:hypothetical protein